VSQLRASDGEHSAVEGYIHEALRIDPPFRGVYRESLADQKVGNLSILKGQRVFLDLAHANSDPIVFTDPTTVDVHRESKDNYLPWDGVTRSLGVELTTRIIRQVLRAVFEFDGLRRASGSSGMLKRYNIAEGSILRYEYLGAGNLPTPWPSSLLVQINTSAVSRKPGTLSGHS